ncbi:FtsB family cell division protein [Pseudooceanicola aestuarii]|uniref:FtsB family cell division protein n=1 Tax=Pseudooceanicola aestuarii TaxID=2697319 RepID=UPI0013D30332|nr:septum formation initiator family protein [Pseudooceanicola aestuarii]
MRSDTRPTLGTLFCISGALVAGLYFSFAAVQGEFGLFRRAEVEAESAKMRQQLAELEARITDMENRTQRLSDDFLDLDLLDQQARDVLGLLRGDEIVIR